MEKGYFLKEETEEIEFVENIYQIYNRIEDNISKDIFTNCLLHSMTNDIKYVRKNIVLSDIGSKFTNLLREVGKVPIYIYGAGKRGRELTEIYPEINWGGFIDKNKRGSCDGLSIVNLSQFKYESGASIVISNYMGYEEICQELVDFGIEKNKIIICEKWNKEMASCQYFEKRCISKERTKGGFVDVGSFDGMDSIRYIEWQTNDDSRIWAFEPDSVQYRICEKRLKQYKNAQVIEAGISEKTEKKKMTMLHNGMSSIGEEGEEITTIALDDILSKEKIGYIKIDIEGYEEKALRGAEKIIREQNPALAICVYHRKDDLWRIPSLLLEYNPNYHFSFGHYEIVHAETVLYAY